MKRLLMKHIGLVVGLAVSTLVVNVCRSLSGLALLVRVVSWFCSAPSLGIAARLRAVLVLVWCRRPSFLTALTFYVKLRAVAYRMVRLLQWWVGLLAIAVKTALVLIWLRQVRNSTVFVHWDSRALAATWVVVMNFGAIMLDGLIIVLLGLSVFMSLLLLLSGGPLSGGGRGRRIGVGFSCVSVLSTIDRVILNWLVTCRRAYFVVDYLSVRWIRWLDSPGGCFRWWIKLVDFLAWVSLCRTDIQAVDNLNMVVILLMCRLVLANVMTVRPCTLALLVVQWHNIDWFYAIIIRLLSARRWSMVGLGTFLNMLRTIY